MLQFLLSYCLTTANLINTLLFIVIEHSNSSIEEISLEQVVIVNVVVWGIVYS